MMLGIQASPENAIPRLVTKWLLAHLVQVSPILKPPPFNLKSQIAQMPSSAGPISPFPKQRQEKPPPFECSHSRSAFLQPFRYVYSSGVSKPPTFRPSAISRGTHGPPTHRHRHRHHNVHPPPGLSPALTSQPKRLRPSVCSDHRCQRSPGTPLPLLQRSTKARVCGIPNFQPKPPMISKAALYPMQPVPVQHVDAIAQSGAAGEHQVLDTIAAGLQELSPSRLSRETIILSLCVATRDGDTPTLDCWPPQVCG